MKKYLQYFVVLLPVLLMATGCEKDDSTVKKITGNNKLKQDIISGVNGPTTGLVNEELEFSILWDSSDSTQTFDRLQDSTYHNTKVIKLFIATKNSDTTQVHKKTTDPILYKFKSATAGTYYLKFYKPDNTDQSAIIDTVIISK